MLTYYAKVFLQIGQSIEFVRNHLFELENPADENDHGELDKKLISQNMKELASLCEGIHLDVSAALLANNKNKKRIPETLESYELLIDTIYSEIGVKKLFYMPEDRVKYYHDYDPVSYEARSAFPISGQELRSAGNCYAVYQHTACVYHCMRALEGGLRALAIDVGVTWTVEQWHVIINQIEKAIKELGNTLPKGQEKSDRLQFLSEAAKEFAWFKDGWRNYAAHARKSYDDTQALKTLEHTCAFFEVISRHLKE